MIAADVERPAYPRSPGSTPTIPPAALTSAARSSLARAVYVRDARSRDEEEAVERGRADLREGLTYPHEHVKRLLGPDWHDLGAVQASHSVALAIVWTRNADMMHLGDPARERALHRVLEQFASTGAGNVFAQLRPDEYRLEAQGFRIHIAIEGAKMVVLSVRSE